MKREIAELEKQLEAVLETVNTAEAWSDQWLAATDRVAELRNQISAIASYSV